MPDTVLAFLATFGVSMVPVLELRAGIPLGVALGLPPAVATAAGILGNIAQIQMALVTVAMARRYGDRIPRLRRWLERTERQVAVHSRLLNRYGWIGLALFVLLPLPATGVWGGAVLSCLLQLRAGPTWLGLGTGIALSGILFGLGVTGALSGLEWLGILHR